MRTVSLACLLVLVACGPAPKRADNGDDDGGDDTPDASQPNPADAAPTVDAAGCQKIDVLFVIDNSGSMGQEQANLIANFPGFISVLDASGLDYRVAVTTTGRDYSWQMTTPFGTIPESQDGGDNGAMLQPASCNMTKRWIEKTDADVTGTFSCVANVGTGGPSDEMPLSAMRDAFEERMTDGTNVGFHRPAARHRVPH
jgi:hypothetical protein